MVALSVNITIKINIQGGHPCYQWRRCLEKRKGGGLEEGGHSRDDDVDQHSGYDDDENYVIGDADDLLQVWIATELLWVVSEEEVVEFDKEEDSWCEVQDLVSSQF